VNRKVCHHWQKAFRKSAEVLKGVKFVETIKKQTGEKSQCRINFLFFSMRHTVPCFSLRNFLHAKCWLSLAVELVEMPEFNVAGYRRSVKP